MRIASQGRQLAQEHGNLAKEGYILISMGLIAIEQKEPLHAQEYLERALAIAQQTGNRRLESRALGNLGNFAGFVLQDYMLARKYHERVLGLFRLLGERSQEAVLLSNLGWVAGMLGDLDAAFSYSIRSLPLLREVGNLYAEANTLINLSANAGVRNDIPASLEFSQKALELSRATGDKAGEAWSYLYMGYAYLAQKNFLSAEESFQHSMSIRDELGQPGLKTEPLAGLVQSLLSRGEQVRALAETEKILSYLQSAGSLEGTEEPLRVYYACYLALNENRDSRFTAILQSAEELLETQVLKLRDEEARRKFIENVPWRLAIHREWHDHALPARDNNRRGDHPRLA
jgi:tetratricopeptide (TPR) repeat protein